MTPSSSRLSFVAQGRTRRLYRVTPTGPFYVRFQYRGVDYPRCTGTTIESVAKIKAKQIIDAVFREHDPGLQEDERRRAGEDSRRLKMRSDYALLADLVEVYRQRYGTDARRKRTVQTNVSALEKMVRLAGHSFAGARANVLTAELVRAFEEAELKRIARDERGNMLQDSELRVRTSLCSIVKQARSIFKRGTMNWFDAYSLPDLSGFRSQGVQAPERPRPRPLDPGVIESINAAAPALARDDPPCYLAHLLFSRLGMRNGEIKCARRSWIARSTNAKGQLVGKLGIIYRPEEEFKPKKKTERWIPIGPATLAELEARFRMSPDGDFLVPALHKTHRASIVDRRHSQWAGRWIKQRSKVSYELRRYAGSLLYTKTRSLGHVQQFLGHADLKTTTDWYWYLLEEPPALDAEDFAVPLNLKVLDKPALADAESAA